MIKTGGIASATQIVDSTGVYTRDTGYVDSSATSGMLLLDYCGNEIAIESIEDKLREIRKKSHSELGEAWSRLAKM